MGAIFKAENISKQYRLGLVGTGTLNDDFKRWWYRIQGKEDPFLKVGAVNDRGATANEDYVWALRDINFEVNHGEVLGIIGKNGAGKSTLLKILSRVTSPTTGSIKTRGRIASLLEIGTGFHGELTGRENIFLNGAVLGMSKTEIKSKLDEIIAFSGCEMYIDTPVKRYSSGMTVRLGFAVAAHLEPEILVIDEVLAVGDAEFQKKAIGKMQDLSTGEGRTVLFVSHNMGSIKSLCSRGLVLSKGNLSFEGKVSDCIDYYMNQDINEISTGIINFENEILGDDDIRLLEFSVSDVEGRIRTTFSQSEEIVVRLRFEAYKNLSGMRVNIRLKTMDDEIVFMSSSHQLTKNNMFKGIHTLEMRIPFFLLNNRRYILNMNAGIPGYKYIIRPKDILYLDIISENSGGSDFVEKWPGYIAPRLEWNYVQ